MYIKEKVVSMNDVITGFICSKCKAKIHSADEIEMQEHVCIPILGGYGSVFGDGADLQATFCQQCAYDILNEWMEDVEEIKDPSDQPYLIETRLLGTPQIIKSYNPDYGDKRVCECGHAYYRHFDTYMEMDPCGCKYCGCGEFTEARDEEEDE